MLSAAEAMDRYYLDVRCALVEVAATLDRIDRGEGTADTARIQQLHDALALLQSDAPEPNRAERMLRLFSDLDGLTMSPLSGDA